MNDLVLASHAATDPLLAAPRQQTRSAAGSPRDLLFVLFWHRRKVVTFFVAALALTAIVVLAMPSRYLSQSTLLNKMGSETVTPDATALPGGTVIQPVIQREMQMKTELEVLKSNEIALAVVRKVGAGTLLGRRDTVMSDSESDPLFKQALIALQKNLDLDVVPESNVLNVGYESSDPKLAQAVVSAYVEQYLIHRTHVYTNARSASFLRGERDLSIQKLAEMEDNIRKLKDEAGIGNIDEQRLILQQRIGTMQHDATDARTQHIGADAEVAQLIEQLKVVPPKIVSSQTHNQAMNWIDETRKDVAKTEQELNDARARYMPGSPQIHILEDKIAGGRALIASAGDTGGESIETTNPTYQELSTRLETSRVDAKVAAAKEAAIVSELQDADAQLKKVNQVEQKIKAMLRAANLSEDTLKMVAEAADRATLMAAFEGEKLNNVTVVQPATLPLKPVAPNRLMLLALGMFVAATGAVGLGIASETLSRSAKRPEDIDRIASLPCVSVPVVDETAYLGHAAAPKGWSLQKLLPGRADAPAALVTRAKHSNGAGPMRSTAAGTTDVRPLRRWSPQLLQAGHGIVDGLLFDSILRSRAPQSFVTGLISCRPGQGASTLSAYVASAIADRLEASMALHADDQVLLIDADLAEPTQHRLLGCNESPGLGDWLMVATDHDAALDAFVQPTNHPRLSLLPAGRSSGAARLLDRTDRLLVEAAREHRHVVIDLPPLSSTPTALRLAAKCNAVLLVVECGNLHQEVVRRSVRALQAAGTNVAGVVLNKRRFPIPDWLYERAS